MKKQFFVPALVALFLSLSATAGENNLNTAPDQTPDVEVGLVGSGLPDHSITARNVKGTGHSMWVTIYNTFDSIRDSGCVKEGEERVFTGYYNPMTFRFRAEVTKDVNCGGPKVDDLSLNFAMPFNGDGTAIQLMNGDRGFYLAQKSSRQAQVQAQAHDEIQVQNKSDRSAWVTIYNTFESIRDVGCVKANDQIAFSGYKGPLPFKIRVEAKENVNCGGNTVFDASGTVSLMTAWKGIGILEGSANTGYKFNTKSE